jgi:hypothetical protein
MKICSLCLPVILICLCSAGYGQPKDRSDALQTEHIIPFELTPHNNISVKAILNRRDTVHLMFHTAASDLTLTEEATGKIKSLKYEGTDSVKSWGGSSNASRFSKGNFLQIGDREWKEVSIWENKNSGPGTDGKFGTDLFANQVIEIDFERKRIILHAGLPAKTAQYEKLKLDFENDMLFIEASCTIGTSTFRNRFLLHSGYSGGILFDDKFAADNRLGDKLTIVGEKSLKDSYGNILKTKKAILPTLVIGRENLSDVPAGFFEGAIGRQKMSIFGGDLLKRFNIIIDEKRAFIYLKANQLKELAYTKE